MKLELELVDHKVSIKEDVRVLDVFELGNYIVKRLTVHEGGKLMWTSITVVSGKEYMPEIQYDDGFFNEDKKAQFTIQTTAYGSKSVDEIKKIVAGYQEAIEVVEILTKNFC